MLGFLPTPSFIGAVRRGCDSSLKHSTQPHPPYVLALKFTYGGYWIAVGVAEPAIPWRSAYSAFVGLSAVYFMGLALGWRHCFSARA